MEKIRIEEVRNVKEIVVSFLRGYNYAISDFDDFVVFHDMVANNEIDLDELAEYLYYTYTYSWTSPTIYKQLILEVIPSLEYAIQGKDSNDEVFKEYIETSTGVDCYFKNDMFYIYYPKTKRIFEIIEQYQET